MVATPDTCPTDEELAAFIDGMALPDERERVTAHLTTCPDCHEIYITAMQFQDESRPQETGLPSPLPFVPRRGVPRWVVASVIAAAAAVLAVVVVPPLLRGGRPDLSATDLLANLQSAAQTTTLAALAPLTYQPPVMRGPGDEKDLELPSQDFQLGVGLVGLLLKLKAESTETADETLIALGQLSDQGGDAEHKRLWDSVRQTLRNGAPHPDVLRKVESAEAEIRKMRDDEGSPELRFGEWTEASRLAALGEIASYFENRDVRDYLAWIQKQKTVRDNSAAFPLLRSIAETLAKKPLTANDFRDLQQQLAEIIKAYQKQIDLSPAP